MGEDQGRGAPPAGPAGDDLDEAEPEKAPFALVAQFFLIPLAVVVVTVVVFLLFGLATHEKRSPDEYLQEVRTGSRTRRWQAAFAFSTEMAKRPELGQDARLFQDTLDTFRTAPRDEPQVRRYLALALGRFSRPESVAALIEALNDPDEETRLYAAIALGSIKDRAAVEPLSLLLRAEEPAVRKIAAFALGQIGDAAAAPALRVAAEDGRADVALQAAAALAQVGDPAGLPTLRRWLDRAYVDAVADMSPEQRAEAMVNAIQGLLLLKDGESLPRLNALAKDDPALAVRDAALQTSEAIARGDAAPDAPSVPDPLATATAAP